MGGRRGGGGAVSQGRAGVVGRPQAPGAGVRGARRRPAGRVAGGGPRGGLVLHGAARSGEYVVIYGT